MSTPRATAQAENPEFPFLDPADLEGTEALMHRLGYLHDDETVRSIEKAGEGNMNLVLRVRTALQGEARSFVLKQSRPWVEKYDSIPAPWDRVVSERRFYERVSGIDGVADRMPKLLGHDDASRTLLLQDLGEASDLSDVYAGHPINTDELDTAAEYLHLLHTATAGERGGDFANTEMRALNHAHIYDIPLTDHGTADLDELEPGLNEAADEAQADDAFVAAVKATGERYLAEPGANACLLHGDFFPGSLLRTSKGLRVIDPEFCYAGDPCFDVAVMTAHLVLADRPAGDIQRFHDAYDVSRLDAPLLARFAACEVMRRLIGVAQLPMAPTVGHRTDLLQRSREAVVNETLQPLLP